MTRSVSLLLTFLTGFSGLVYQVTWQRYLAILLGSHAEATAAVLGLFLGGLSGGYALFGRLTRRRVDAAARENRPAALLAFYGVVEAAIGLYALLFPWLFDLARGISVWIPETGPGLGFALDVTLCALLLLPPTLLMGGTIPILTQALARSLQDATRVHAFVYAFNTAGAFAGALAAGFWLIAWLGFVGVMFAMGSVNLLAGAIFVWLGREREDALPAEAPGPRRRVAGLPAYATAALLSGFAMMTLEVVLVRVGGLSFGSSEYSFSMVIAVFVLCIALGSFAVSALPRIHPSVLLVNQLLLVALLIGLYGLIPRAPWAAHVLRTLFTHHDLAFLPYYGLAFVAVLAVISPPVLLSGASLPLIFDHLRRREGELGAVAGVIYSWNTVGSLLGALVGGYALFFWLDLHQVFRVAVGALVVGVVVLGLHFRRRAFGVAALVLALPLSAALLAQPAWRADHLTPGLFRERSALAYTFGDPDTFIERYWGPVELLFHRDDPTTTVTVFEGPWSEDEMVRGLAVNGKPDSATRGDSATTGLLALLPALFADQNRSAFVVGYGTGVTVGELARLPEMQEVVVAEISQGVIDAAPLFDFANGDAFSHPRVRVVRSDAYRALLRGRRRYDVIASAPSNPWVTGVEMLYSREFLEAARSQLAPGGVYCQFFHQYETDAEALTLVLRTYTQVFDDVSVWYGTGADVLLLGFQDPRAALDLARLQARFAQPAFREALQRADVGSFPALLAHELLPLGVVHAAGFEGPIHTLERPLLNHVAGRAFFRGALVHMPFTGSGEAARVGRENSLLGRHLRSFPDGAPDAVRGEAVAEACLRRARQCTTHLAAWGRSAPESPALGERLRVVRRSGTEFGGAAATREASRLVGLYAEVAPGAAVLATDSPVPPAVAERATRLYRTYYQHAVPFDPEPLLSLWDRCDGDAAACERGRAEARALLQGPAPPG